MVWAGTADNATEPSRLSGIRGQQGPLGTSTTRGAERLEAATVRRRQRHVDPDGARRLARERRVVTASDLIRDRTERRRLDQFIAEGLLPRR